MISGLYCTNIIVSHRNVAQVMVSRISHPISIERIQPLVNRFPFPTDAICSFENPSAAPSSPFTAPIVAPTGRIKGGILRSVKVCIGILDDALLGVKSVPSII